MLKFYLAQAENARARDDDKDDSFLSLQVPLQEVQQTLRAWGALDDLQHLLEEVDVEVGHTTTTTTTTSTSTKPTAAAAPAALTANLRGKTKVKRWMQRAGEDGSTFLQIKKDRPVRGRLVGRKGASMHDVLEAIDALLAATSESSAIHRGQIGALADGGACYAEVTCTACDWKRLRNKSVAAAAAETRSASGGVLTCALIPFEPPVAHAAVAQHLAAHATHATHARRRRDQAIALYAACRGVEQRTRRAARAGWDQWRVATKRAAVAALAALPKALRAVVRRRQASALAKRLTTWRTVSACIAAVVQSATTMKSTKARKAAAQRKKKQKKQQADDALLQSFVDRDAAPSVSAVQQLAKVFGVTVLGAPTREEAQAVVAAAIHAQVQHEEGLVGRAALMRGHHQVLRRVEDVFESMAFAAGAITWRFARGGGDTAVYRKMFDNLRALNQQELNDERVDQVLGDHVASVDVRTVAASAAAAWLAEKRVAPLEPLTRAVRRASRRVVRTTRAAGSGSCLLRLLVCFRGDEKGNPALTSLKKGAAASWWSVAVDAATHHVAFFLPVAPHAAMRLHVPDTQEWVPYVAISAIAVADRCVKDAPPPPVKLCPLLPLLQARLALCPGTNWALESAAHSLCHQEQKVRGGPVHAVHALFAHVFCDDNRGEGSGAAVAHLAPAATCALAGVVCTSVTAASSPWDIPLDEPGDDANAAATAAATATNVGTSWILFDERLPPDATGAACVRRILGLLQDRLGGDDGGAMETKMRTKLKRFLRLREVVALGAEQRHARFAAGWSAFNR